MRINPLSEEIKADIPVELIPAIEALDKTLEEAHFLCGRVTEVFCYSLLHPGERLEEAKQHQVALSQLKAIVGPAETASFHQNVKMGTAPAIFHAMHQLYIAAITVQSTKVFNDLLEIGRAHPDQMGKPYVQWAHDLTLELVKKYENQVKSWIRAVCDPPESDKDLNWDDLDEIIMGKTWCAPMLIVMSPSRYMPFDATREWERTDRETSKRWLTSFARMFTIHVKMRIDDLADKKTVELAKQPKSPAISVDDPVRARSTEEASEGLSVKREYRKGKIEERNKKIRAELKKLEKRKPGMSNVWYSEKLSGLEIADGLNSESIRKIIRS